MQESNPTQNYAFSGNKPQTQPQSAQAQQSSPQSAVAQTTGAVGLKDENKIVSKIKSCARSSKTKFIAGALILALFFYIIFSSIFSAPSTLTVLGEGTLDFDADKVSMVVTVVSSGTTASDAINAGEQEVAGLIALSKDLAGDDAEVKKAFYQVQPSFTERGRSYQVANAFSLSFSDVAKTNEVVKSLYDQGATTVSNVSFSAQDEQAVAQMAREKAVDDSKMQAKSIAKASGKRLGKILSISEDNKNASGSVASESESGNDFSTVSVTKVVSVVYELK